MTPFGSFLSASQNFDTFLSAVHPPNAVMRRGSRADTLVSMPLYAVLSSELLRSICALLNTGRLAGFRLYKVSISLGLSTPASVGSFAKLGIGT